LSNIFFGDYEYTSCEILDNPEKTVEILKHSVLIIIYFFLKE